MDSPPAVAALTQNYDVVNSLQGNGAVRLRRDRGRRCPRRSATLLAELVVGPRVGKEVDQQRLEEGARQAGADDERARRR